MLGTGRTCSEVDQDWLFATVLPASVSRQTSQSGLAGLLTGLRPAFLHTRSDRPGIERLPVLIEQRQLAAGLIHAATQIAKLGLARLRRAICRLVFALLPRQ